MTVLQTLIWYVHLKHLKWKLSSFVFQIIFCHLYTCLSVHFSPNIPWECAESFMKRKYHWSYLAEVNKSAIIFSLVHVTQTYKCGTNITRYNTIVKRGVLSY